MPVRSFNRGPRDLRPVTLTPGYTKHAEGSCLVEFGDTKVICTASTEEKVPPHIMGTSSGWVTAEYGMLPRSTHTRSPREAAKGKQGGRTLEIQRLIGRALRASVESSKELGVRTFHLDCDVLQADGGTRTASITGAYVALALACRKLVAAGSLKKMPTLRNVAAVSVGIVKGELCLDLDYEEDSHAEVDLNVAALALPESLALVEVQGTAEGKPFARAQLDAMLDVAMEGAAHLVRKQREVLGGVKVVVATRNAGKVAELRGLAEAQGLAIEWESLAAHPGVPEVVEDADSFSGNAQKKAREVAAATGLAALADDSGLCVDALGGGPGVYSARFAPGSDADRVQHLLTKLEATPDGQRGAHFTCVLCLALPGGERFEAEGRCVGRIARAPRGSHGFGYDPVFELPDGRMMAELERAQKAALSHRAIAFAAMVPHLRTLAARSA